jgi:hypothetical protein
MPTNDDPPLADDRLPGVKKIAEFLGESERRTQYLIETRQIPVPKLGNRYEGSKTRLREFFAALQGNAG